MTMISSMNDAREVSLTDDSISDHFTKLSSRFELVQGHPNGVENQSIMNVWLDAWMARTP
jgi:hypothetical protein